MRRKGGRGGGWFAWLLGSVCCNVSLAWLCLSAPMLSVVVRRERSVGKVSSSTAVGILARVVFVSFFHFFLLSAG